MKAKKEMTDSQKVMESIAVTMRTGIFYIRMRDNPDDQELKKQLGRALNIVNGAIAGHGE